MKILILSRVCCGIPQSITQLKAFLGATQQKTQYVSYYALVAAPLHKLTIKDQHFPIRSKWIQESKYDIAYHHMSEILVLLQTIPIQSMNSSIDRTYCTVNNKTRYTVNSGEKEKGKRLCELNSPRSFPMLIAYWL